jgi:hypothetical protein
MDGAMGAPEILMVLFGVGVPCALLWCLAVLFGPRRAKRREAVWNGPLTRSYESDAEDEFWEKP